MSEEKTVIELVCLGAGEELRRRSFPRAFVPAAKGVVWWATAVSGGSRDGASCLCGCGFGSQAGSLCHF
ncbi:hypothetical protein, partial [Rhodopirellula bahusiensis]|uniref:hypothetical protein n=1 Tax=Rhodopirellula bahusiensis TaxID=2014065 RepID=UPI00326499AC